MLNRMHPEQPCAPLKGEFSGVFFREIEKLNFPNNFYFIECRTFPYHAGEECATTINSFERIKLNGCPQLGHHPAARQPAIPKL